MKFAQTLLIEVFEDKTFQRIFYFEMKFYHGTFFCIHIEFENFLKLFNIQSLLWFFSKKKIGNKKAIVKEFKSFMYVLFTL